MATNEELYDDASLAINEVFSDTSVDASETARQLQSLREEINHLLQTLEDD